MLLKSQDYLSNQRGMPVHTVSGTPTAVTGETVTLNYYNAGVLTSDAGQAAGVLVIGKFAKSNILNAVHDVLATNLDTSLSFTCDALTTEKRINHTILDNGDQLSGLQKLTNITTGFANGEYCIDYRTGTIYGKKATTTSSMTSVAYYYMVTLGSGGGAASDINVNQVGGDAVAAANTARTTATKVVPTQPIDAAGNVLGQTAANTARTTGTLVTPAQIVDAAGNVIGISAANTARAATDKVLLVQNLDSSGKVGSGSTGVSGGGYTMYAFDNTNSMGQGSVAYTAATQLTVSGLSFTPNPQLLNKIEQYTSAGALTNTFTPQTYTITYSAGVYTVTGATFGATDLFVIYQQGPERTSNLATNSQQTIEGNGINYQCVEESLVDAINTAGATIYYPSSLGATMLGYRNLSLSGKLIDADATLPMTLEVTNDEDATNADWIQVYGYDAKNNSLVNSISAVSGTTTFEWDFDNLNVRFWRVKVVPTDATNTMIIKARRSTL
jgi:hypothetical protein